MQEQHKLIEPETRVRPDRTPTSRQAALVPKAPDWLAYLYAPILPLLTHIKINREGPRH